jgi:hypothetical protein
MSRSIPILGGISLELVQRIEHSLDGGFAPTPIAGLAGDLQQRSNRRSHRIDIAGALIGDKALDELKKLQDAAAAGEELDFSADISSALDLQKVVITGFRGVESAGRPGRYLYTLSLVESPPLPAPAQLGGIGAFGGLGGLDDFGVGDLGFDTDILGDIADLAGDIAAAVDDALGVLDALSALANLDGLNVGGILEPMQGPVDGIGAVAPELQTALKSLADAFGGGA